MEAQSTPRFPIYIPSKGRSKYMMTSRALTEMGVQHYIIVEPQEREEYEKSVREMKLFTTVLELDMSYKSKYELCDEFGLTKTTGSGPARNFAWDHSLTLKAPFEWTMDDNIRGFYRLNKNKKIKVGSGVFFRAMEDFVLRYENVAMAGPAYHGFADQRSELPPFILNTRLYSCNLIRTDVPFRWRGRYNEDTILSIDMLKAGWCTIQFFAFLQAKIGTQALPGGNTQELYVADGGTTKKKGEKYAKGGTVAKSEMLVRVHPDVATLVWKWHRCHHHVDYRPFRANKLIRRKAVDFDKLPQVDNYGMELKKIK